MKHYPLLDEFTLELLNQNLTGGSILSYTSYLRTFVPDSAPKVDQNYLTIVALALSAKKGAFALQYLDDIQSKYGVVAGSKKQSAFNAFKAWIAGIVAAFNNKALASVKASLASSGIEAFSQSNLYAKMGSRIITQSRLSGDKIWLPLVFIQKFCNDQQRNSHIVFKQTVYDKLKVLAGDDVASSGHIDVKDIVSLAITDEGMVFCIYAGKEGNLIPAQIFTPTGELNKRDEMVAGSISDIVIDHVTPIDRTLRLLALPELEKITTFVKAAKAANRGLTGKDLEEQAFDDFYNSSLYPGHIDLDDLESELMSIVDDSHYRLVHSDMNSSKSNVIDYKEFYKDGDDYYAFIAEADSGQSVIYQDLKQNCLSVFNGNKQAFIAGKKAVGCVNVPIDIL